MSKPEWGTKRICTNPACRAKFYDFSKPEIFCPKCGTVFDIEALIKPKRGRRKASPDVVEAAINLDEIILEEDSLEAELEDEIVEVDEVDENFDEDYGKQGNEKRLIELEENNDDLIDTPDDNE